MANFFVRGRSTPTDPAERMDKEKRDLRAKGWDGDRAREYLRSRVREDKQGRKQLDLK